MLTGHFDDSGTHRARVVIWAGVFGNQYQWDALDADWAEVLKNPCPGKEPLARFHMSHCEAQHKEFLHWKRHEADYLVGRLSDIIVKKGIYGYAIAVSRKDWEELMVGDLRTIYGDPEGHCLRSCYVGALRWARRMASYDRHMAFVFDQKPDRHEENQRVFDAFQMHSVEDGIDPQLASLTFSSSYNVPALQAADMFAWEFYRDAQDILDGTSVKGKPPLRKQFAKLINTNRFTCRIARREDIETIIKRSKSERLAKAAKYFEDLYED